MAPPLILLRPHLAKRAIYTTPRGFLAGGYDNSTAIRVDAIQSFDFSTEEFKTLSAKLATPKSGVSGVASSLMAYVGTGAPHPITTIDTIDFRTESSASLGSVIAKPRRETCGVSAVDKGFTAGGYTSSASSEIDKVEFGTNTYVDIAAALSQARYFVSGVSSRGTSKGYIGGGYTGSVRVNKIDRIDYSTEACAGLSATLSVARHISIPIHSNARGLWCGGHLTSGRITEIDGLDFSTETAINPSAALVVGTSEGTGLSYGTVGYVCGGRVGSGASTMNVHKYDFSTDSITSNFSTLDSQPAILAAGASQQ